MSDASVFAFLFNSEGALPCAWERASRCTTPREDGSPCFSEDTHQPNWNCTTCGGLGVTYAPVVLIRALFRGQSRWTSHKSSGEHGLGEAQLTTPVDVEPLYVDERVRDRFRLLAPADDAAQGRVFYPAAKAVPFVFAGVQRAWRVQLQSLTQTTRVRPQP